MTDAYQEAEKYRNAYFGLRRENELLKTKLEQEVEAKKAMVTDAQEREEQLRRSLTMEIEALKQLLQQAPSDDLLQQLQQHNAELERQKKHMTQEIQELRWVLTEGKLTTGREANKKVLEQADEQARAQHRQLTAEREAAKELAEERDQLYRKVGYINFLSLIVWSVRTCKQMCQTYLEWTKTWQHK